MLRPSPHTAGGTIGGVLTRTTGGIVCRGAMNRAQALAIPAAVAILTILASGKS